MSTCMPGPMLILEDTEIKGLKTVISNQAVKYISA